MSYCKNKIVALALTLCACNSQDDMQLSYQHTVQVGLYSAHTAKDTALTDFVAYGEGREDSLLIDEASTSGLFLNLDLHRCTTQFVLRTQTLQDELTLCYRKKLTSVSGSGGIAMDIVLDTAMHTQTFIDSVAITHSAIKYNESLENLRIFVY